MIQLLKVAMSPVLLGKHQISHDFFLQDHIVLMAVYEAVLLPKSITSWSQVRVSQRQICDE